MSEKAECTTYTQIVLAIAKEDERITHLNAAYHHLRDELKAIDAEVMRSYKKKWLLERRLFTIQKCKPAGPAGPRTSKSSTTSKMPSIKDLNPDQTEELLNFLTDLKKES